MLFLRSLWGFFLCIGLIIFGSFMSGSPEQFGRDIGKWSIFFGGLGVLVNGTVVLFFILRWAMSRQRSQQVVNAPVQQKQHSEIGSDDFRDLQ